jgi:hypothetical protein
MGHHRIHGSGRDGKTEPGPPKGHEGILGSPVRLSYDADPETMFLKPTGQERHAKSRVVDVGIAADKNDIQFTPAAPDTIFSGCGNK